MSFLKKFGFAVMILTGAASSWAAPALQAPDYSLSVQRSGAALSVMARPPAGFHFNLAAPHFLEVTGSKSQQEKHPKQVASVSASEKRVIFALNSGLAPTSFRVSLYLCDDKKTFCELHRVAALWDPKRAALVGQK